MTWIALAFLLGIGFLCVTFEAAYWGTDGFFDIDKGEKKDETRTDFH